MRKEDSPKRALTLVLTGINLKSSEASLLISCSSSHPPWLCPRPDGISSNSSKAAAVHLEYSSRGIVVEDTIDADLKLALLDPDEAELTVDMTERGDMHEVRPDKLLKPLSLLLCACPPSLPSPSSRFSRCRPLGGKQSGVRW